MFLICNPNSFNWSSSTKEGELLELSDNDDLIAVPGVAKSLGNNNQFPQINISAMGDRIVEAINTQNQLLERLAFMARREGNN